MHVSFTSAILASIVCLTVAVAILLRRPRRSLYTYFAAFCGTLFLWHVSTLSSRFAGGGLGAWQLGAAVLIPPAAILFFRALLREHTLGSRTLSSAAYVVSLVLVVLCSTRFGSSPWVQIPAASYVFVTLALINRALYRHMRRARSGTDRKRLSLLLYLGLAALLLAFGELLPQAPSLAAMGHMAATFYIYFLYQSIVARRLVDLVELLGKAAVLAALTLMLASIYALLLLWVGSDEQGLWLFNTLVASFVILIVYDQVRPWIEATTARLLFGQRLELRQLTLQMVRQLRSTFSVVDMRQLVLGALHKSGRVSDAAMYLADDTELSFALSGWIGRRPPQHLTRSLHPVLLAALRERKPILLEQLAHRHQELPAFFMRADPLLQRELERTSEAMASLRAMHASVLIPMLVPQRCVGILVLGAQHFGGSFSTDELALLLSLTEACAVVIENSQAYELRRERDRLVVVGELAAGMAHEIRNPLGAIKGAAQCLEPGALPAEAREFVDVIIEEVDRLGRVVGQFLEYARPLRGNPCRVDVGQVVDKTLRLLAQGGIADTITVTQSRQEALPDVHVDPEHLKQVLINLMQNALQAMPEGGRIHVEMAARTPLGSRGLVLIRVRDTGAGIEQADLARIFLPFFTTKAGGTGLGLAICQRIVENAGGRLDVTSSPGEGTTFTIRLQAA